MVIPDRSTPDRAVRVVALTWVIVLCSWKTLTLLPLHSGVKIGTGEPSQGNLILEMLLSSTDTLSRLHATETGAQHQHRMSHVAHLGVLKYYSATEAGQFEEN